MTDFHFDTSGVVPLPEDGIKRVRQAHRSWPDLSPFVQGYVEAMLTSVELIGQWLDTVDQFHAPGFSDLAPETLTRIIEDCEQFNGMERYFGLRLVAGSSFYKARQQMAIRDFPPLTLLRLSDDGKVHFTP